MSPDREDDRQQEPDEQRRDITGPGGPTSQATHPPGNADRDEDAIRESEEKLDQAGGGH